MGKLVSYNVGVKVIFPGIVSCRKEAFLRLGSTMPKWPPITRRISTWLLDFDYISTQVREDLAAYVSLSSVRSSVRNPLNKLIPSWYLVDEILCQDLLT